MNSTLVFALVFGIGIVAGLRSCTAPAVVCWGAYLQWFSLQGSPLHFMASLIAVCIFTILAVVELVGDKLPSTPNRTAAVGLGARIVLGGLAGATLAVAAGQAGIAGAVIAAVGALAGTLGGFHFRRALSQTLPPVVAALVEDVIAVGGGLLLVSRM